MKRRTPAKLDNQLTGRQKFRDIPSKSILPSKEALSPTTQAAVVAENLDTDQLQLDKHRLDKRPDRSRSRQTTSTTTVGPFPVIFDEAPDPHTLNQPNEAPLRRYECGNYQCCLELAAALNWESFTCVGCSGEINDKLVWKAHLAQRGDKVAEQLCDLPKIGCFESAESEDTLPMIKKT